MNSASQPEARPRRNRLWRKLTFFALVLLLVAVPAYVVYLEIKSRIPGVTIDNFRRLRAGMTESQIESYLGPKLGQTKNEGWEGDNPLPTTSLWEGPDFRVVVDFNGKGRASEIRLHPKHRGELPETFADRVRRWLGKKGSG
jgi:hypothetical protein